MERNIRSRTFLHLVETLTRAASHAGCVLTLAGLTVTLGLTTPAVAQEVEPAPGAAAASDGPTFPIGSLRLRYLRQNPLHPSEEQAMQMMVTLGKTPTGYVAPRDDVETVEMSLENINDLPVETYHASAIQHVLERVRDYFVAEQLLGVYAAPEPTQINEVGQDLRTPGDTDLTIVITTGIVTELRTVASGERVDEKRGIHPDDRINNSLHRRIIDRSPVIPYAGGEEDRFDLLRKDELDAFLFHLGRHPGRRVDASVSAAQDIGTIALDYLITENYPLTLYVQGGNWGTDSTDEWRQRFGFFHTQFTGNDDILSLDYQTASFDQVHAVSGSYEAPFQNYYTRWRVFGGYSEYDAAEVGALNRSFTGDSYQVGGDIAHTFFQDRHFFADLIGGVRFSHISVSNEILPGFALEGEEDFILPYVGVRTESKTEWYTTRMQGVFEFQVTDPDPVQLELLGRTSPDDNWTKFRWNMGHSFFLEPVLNRAGWEDPSTPETSTLAHEIALSFRGQYAFDNRLIPQEQITAGGVYSVRGYPESVIAGDTVFLGSAEYRFHLPRALDIQPEPTELFGQPFRTSPQYVYGTPDWDLIFKGFIDVGVVEQSNRLSFEDDETLIGAGIGLDLLVRRNLTIRLDWGFALKDHPQLGVDSGDTELTFIGTLLY